MKRNVYKFPKLNCKTFKMFNYIIVLLLLLKSSICVSQNDQMLFPDESGNVYLINLNEEFLTSDDIMIINDDNFPVYFTLYTDRAPSGVQLTINDSQSLQNGYWTSTNPTRIITHGWQSQGINPSCQIIVNSYLKLRGYNIIVMDWSSVAKDLVYLRAAKKVSLVANRLTGLINWFIDLGIVVSDLKCIGHSLGAHVVGLGSLKAKSVIGMVAGLDPAGPAFLTANSDQRIDKRDAKNVQIIHTNAGRLGLAQPIGYSDFYPNGGSQQNGCGLDLTGACSHSRAYEYYAESVLYKTGFRATPTTLTDNSRSSNYAFMGGPVFDSNAVNAYTLKTASQPLYALG